VGKVAVAITGVAIPIQMTQARVESFIIVNQIGLYRSIQCQPVKFRKPGDTPTASPSVSESPAATAASGDTIKVGILHSLSGTIAISEKSVVDAEQLAIAEINAAGGIG
jgi:urea transport system substrate-binding protein